VPGKKGPHVAAAIDIGSNSVHLLTAVYSLPELDGDPVGVSAVDDRSDLIGLGDVVDANGVVPPEQLQAVVDAVHELHESARADGAERVLVLGTEPLRRARNSDEVGAAIGRYVGVTLHTLSEREEAQLTFLGVTGGSSPGDTLAVVDIGGGSTEVALRVPGRAMDVIPIATGSARLTNAIVRSDPPTAGELAALLAAARTAVETSVWPEHDEAPATPVSRAVFVGGTATNVARLGTLDRVHLADDLETLARLPSDEVVIHYVVRQRRARQLAAGVAIVSALLDRFALERAEVSDRSLRDGAIIAAALDGDDWRGDLDVLIG